MSGFPELVPPPIVAPGTVEERAKARLAAARLAKGADDLRQILTMLALWPSQDHTNVTTPV